MAKTTRDAKYSNKIIKAGALLPDTKLLLESWHEDADVQSNLKWVREENLLGKASRSRAQDVLSVLRQRYLRNPEVLRALVTLVKGGMPAESLDRVLYFQAVRSDPLLHGLVAEVLADWSTRSDREEVRPWEIQIGTPIGCFNVSLALAGSPLRKPVPPARWVLGNELEVTGWARGPSS